MPPGGRLVFGTHVSFWRGLFLTTIEFRAIFHQTPYLYRCVRHARVVLMGVQFE